MGELHRCGLVRFSKRTGKIDTTMVGWGQGLLKLWGLQNTSKTKATLVLDIDTKEPIVEYVGTADGFPEVHKTEDEYEYSIPSELYGVMLEEFEHGKE